MQAVILVAGKSHRFYPFTNAGHKSLIKVMGKTILEHTLLSIKKSGIKDIIIVIGKDSPIVGIIGDGKRLNLQIHYVVQPESLGMGEALLRADSELQEDFFVINANHVDFHEFAPDMMQKDRQKDDIVLLGRKEESMGIYGCMQVQGDKVIGFIEKPTEILQSSLRHIGIYLFTKKYMEVLKKTPFDHYHLEHAIDTYAKQRRVTYVETDRETVTLKYAWDVLTVQKYLMDRMESYISPTAEVSEHALLVGNVYIDDGAKILEGVTLKGPVYIGKNAVVGNNALLRQYVCIEENAVAGSCIEVTKVLMMEKSTSHSGFIGDSIIGSNCKIGAMFCSANARLDRKNITGVVRENKIDSQRRHLGTIIGDNVIIAARVTTMPGIIIGNDSLIGPATVVMKNVEENTKFYTEFTQVIKKQK